MNELTALALELQNFCEEREWKFCIIGGLAVQHLGGAAIYQRCGYDLGHRLRRRGAIHQGVA
jgi:hypothetical protein